MSEEQKVEDEDLIVDDADDAELDATWQDLSAERGDQGKSPLPAKDDLLKGDETPKDEAPADAQPASQPDPWKDAPPELREAHERELAAERTRAENAETVAKRHSGRLTKLDLELKTLREQLGPKAEGAEGGKEATNREERRKQLREEYPDSAGELVEDIVNLETEVREIKDSLAGQADAQTETLLEEQVSILKSAHPAWETEIKDNPKFVAWAEQQPAYTQRVIVENAKAIVSGHDVADVISRFKRDTADPEAEREQQRRQEQLDAGADLGVRRPAAQPGRDDDPDRTWNELAGQRERQAGNRR